MIFPGFLKVSETFLGTQGEGRRAELEGRYSERVHGVGSHRCKMGPLELRGHKKGGVHG
jgi:hypothetical protein